MDIGFSGSSLALFTTLSPAGAVAFSCVALFILARRSLPEKQAERLSHALALPLAVVWAGFIASATHLGTPSNALHVISGVGRSPLSNEVVAAVMFLFFAGIYWLHSFSVRPSRVVARLLLCAALASAAALLTFTSVAYSVATVPSWDTWHASANIWFSGLLAGPSLAAVVLQASKCEARRWPGAFVIVSGVALAVGTGLLLAYAGYLATVSNNVATALSLVPGFLPLIVLHFVVGALGIGLQAWGLRVRTSHARGLAFSCIGCALVFIAVAMTRFPFYDAYLSAGF